MVLAKGYVRVDMAKLGFIRPYHTATLYYIVFLSRDLIQSLLTQTNLLVIKVVG